MSGHLLIKRNISALSLLLTLHNEMNTRQEILTKIFEILTL